MTKLQVWWAARIYLQARTADYCAEFASVLRQLVLELSGNNNTFSVSLCPTSPRSGASVPLIISPRVITLSLERSRRYIRKTGNRKPARIAILYTRDGIGVTKLKEEGPRQVSSSLLWLMPVQSPESSCFCIRYR